MRSGAGGSSRGWRGSRSWPGVHLRPRNNASDARAAAAAAAPEPRPGPLCSSRAFSPLHVLRSFLPSRSLFLRFHLAPASNVGLFRFSLKFSDVCVRAHVVSKWMCLFFYIVSSRRDATAYTFFQRFRALRNFSLCGMIFREPFCKSLIE